MTYTLRVKVRVFHGASSFRYKNILFSESPDFFCQVIILLTLVCMGNLKTLTRPGLQTPTMDWVLISPY